MFDTEPPWSSALEKFSLMLHFYTLLLKMISGKQINKEELARAMEKLNISVLTIPSKSSLKLIQNRAKRELRKTRCQAQELCIAFLANCL